MSGTIIVVVVILLYFYLSNLVDKRFRDDQTQYTMPQQSCYGRCSNMGWLETFCNLKKQCGLIN